MDSQSMTRKDFMTLTLTLVGGGAVVVLGCSSSSSPSGTGGSTGAGGSGSGGAAGGHSGGDAATDLHADTAADTGIVCADPVPTTQLPDATGHTHGLIILAATLAETATVTAQTDGFPPGSGAHYHTIMLSPADLSMLRGGGMVTVTTSVDGTPPGHSHMFKVSCH